MTFNVKTAPAIIHRAVCSYRNEQEEKFEKLFNAPDSKGRPIWDLFEGREAVRKYSTKDIIDNDSYKRWFKDKLPKTGYVSFYNLCFRKIEYLECQVMLFPESKDYVILLETYRGWMEEVKERVEAEEEENTAWAETREAQDFQRNAYGD